MKNYQTLLYSKNGYSSMCLANMMLSIQQGERIPTVQEFSVKIGLARGTIQNALKFLIDQNAIELESRGHLGTFLKKKNMRALFGFAGIDSIVGVMPLPYSKRYEGLATGLITGLENQYDIPMSLAYMRGAQNRIAMLMDGRYDFAIVSQYAAQGIIKNDKAKIRIVKSFGRQSYLANHILLLHDKNANGIRDGMRIGVDKDSVDQMKLTEKVCKDYTVEFVPMNYNNVIDFVVKGEVDAAIWNEDELQDKALDINYIEVNSDHQADTEAVLVVKRENETMFRLLDEIISVETVLDTQRLVMEDKISPSY
ncbi:GntR family transcriptional regulator YhfZ [Faecalicoccus sp.]|uniref:GntR family transcriptional regulator YhfZ n=1 Tax=Faecalicoccus sp. TaxID=1971758 RepID=UPI002A83CF42|nr:GntR family transcriptional regulator YhfZ [Faecalicoccus sp.]MDY5111263.1 GntR family transcriptional regulator YhfZ [Faecalicoccus sp.]